MFTFLLNKHRSNVRALSISVLNQLLTSGTNFIFSVYLISVLTPSEFGVYGIIFATMLFIGGIGNALFLTQMVVKTPIKDRQDRLPYAGRVLMMVVLFCLGTTILGMTFGLFSSYFLDVHDENRLLSLMALVAGVSYLLKEFFVRHYYVFRMELAALSVNTAMALGLFITLLSSSYFVGGSYIVKATIALVVGNLIGAFIGFLRSNISVFPMPLPKLREDFLEAWAGGRWATISSLVYFARIHAHTIIVSTVSGVAALGVLNAARIFLTPAVMIVPAVSQVVLPRLAGIAIKDVTRSRKYGRVMTLLLLTAATVYSLSILTLYPWLSPKLISVDYGNLYPLVVVWGVYVCVLSVRNGFEIIIQSEGRFRLQAFANTGSAIATLSFVWLFGMWYGLEGFVMGLVLGEIVLVYLVRK